MRFVMKAVFGVQAIWIFFIILSEVSGAATPSPNNAESSTRVDFTWNGSLKTSSYVLLKDMNKYWSTKVEYCGNHTPLTLFNICRMYYYGPLSPFKGDEFVSGPLSRRGRRRAPQDCCNEPCTRWVIKNKCRVDRSIYHPSKPKPKGTARESNEWVRLAGCIMLASFCPQCTGFADGCTKD